MAAGNQYSKLDMNRRQKLEEGGVRRMMAKAYLMINVTEEGVRNGYRDVVSDLKAIPEVMSIERVSGTCDLIVKVEVPVSNWVVFAANKVLAKKWVKHLHALNVEPFGAGEYLGACEDALVNAKHQ